MRYKFMRFPDGKTKALTFSYDDDCTADRKLVSIFNRYNMKATFNLNSGFFSQDEKNGITSNEINDLFLSSGHEIAVHGANHKAPGLVSIKDGIQDALECRTELERITGTIIRGMAYPDSGITRFENGIHYNDVKTYLQNLGIVYSRTLGGDNDQFLLPEDWHSWMPTAHHQNPKLFDYLDNFLDSDCEAQYASSRGPKLFYLWGHAYEFERNDNWDLIEKFCQKSADKSSIWYATNIEIYDYVTAYRSLVFSADNSIVFNPTLLDIWFVADGKMICIKSGETLKNFC